ncbi:MAG: dihydroorotate dehydrogenase (quinone) [Micavibrio sp.]|nr:dihydroorotate dehydrogenase (quinone) [Micavibrio sp.]
MYKLLRPILLRIPPEKAHRKAINFLKSGYGRKRIARLDSSLITHLAGLEFPNPIGLAAGFDKNAEAVEGLLDTGFGFIELGTVTPKPQDGNPQPRVFRDKKSRSVINRMGFPNVGLKAFKDNLNEYRALHHHAPGPIGVNIGMNKDQSEPVKDYVLLINELSGLASYFTINISSPNTPGLRDLQSKENLEPFLGQIMETRDKQERHRPVFLKLSPDLEDEQIEGISEVVLKSGVDGLVLTNTTLHRSQSLPRGFAKEKGGLSGPFLQERSNELIARFYKLLDGKVPIIGAGGISTASDVIEKMKAGASLVQLYTGLIYEGPVLPHRIGRDLAQLLKTYEYESIADIVGKNIETSDKDLKLTDDDKAA